MAQVVTNENMGEFIQNRSVPEFVPPAEAKPAEQAAPPVDGKPVAVDTPPPSDVKRGPDGKFVKADEPAAAPPNNGEVAKPAEPPARGSDADDDDLPKHAKRVIDKKHRQMKEAEEFARERDAEAAREKQRADAAEAELVRLRGGAKSGPASDTTGKAPDPKDFKTVAEYADALVAFKLAEADRTRAETEAKTRAETAAAESQRVFQNRIQKAIKEIPDYADVVGEADTIVPPAMAQFIVDSELGPQLGYHLAKHPDELERLSKLTPIRQLAEMGKLEAKLEKPATPDTPTPPVTPPVSRAPAPITPLGSENSAVVAKDPSQMSFQELRAFRMAERAAGKRTG